MTLAPGCCSLVPLKSKNNDDGRERRERYRHETSKSCSAEVDKVYPLRAFEPVWIIPPDNDATDESSSGSPRKAFLCAVTMSSSRSWAEIVCGDICEDFALLYDASTYVALKSDFASSVPVGGRFLCNIVNESSPIGRYKRNISPSNLDLRMARIVPGNYLEADGNINVAASFERTGISFGAIYSALPPLDVKHSVCSLKTAPIGLMPLSSVTLRLASVSEYSETSSFPSRKNARHIALLSLMHSCLKRQLCNRIVFFQYNNESLPLDASGASDVVSSTTELVLPDACGGGVFSRVCYCVFDVQSSVDTAGADVASGLPFLVLPSTQIHLIDDNDTQPDTPKEPIASVQVDSTPSCRKSKFVSPAIRVLKNAIQIILSWGSTPCCVDVPRAFLLSGPPGVGKTFAVRTAIDEYRNQCSDSSQNSVRLVSIRGSDLLADGRGAGEAAAELHNIFFSAASRAGCGDAVVIFLDECDALLSSSGDNATTGALGTLLDCLGSSGSRVMSNYGSLPLHIDVENSWNDSGNGWKRLLVVASTNKIDAIPSFLRRPGRFDREICVSPPSSEERLAILTSLLSPYQCRLSPLMAEELSCVAESCVGYVAADLAALVRGAALRSLSKNIGNSDIITPQHLRHAMDGVGASALRDAALSAPPATRWKDIAGDAGGAKTALRRAVEWPRTKKAAFDALGLVPPRGILMHGPPGCAKTTLARAAAGDSGVAFFSLSPADVYASSYVGEAEAVVRRAFSLARSAAPCLLFFDEIDSILGCSNGSGGNGKSGVRGMGRGGERGSSAEARVLSTFLNEMDGVDGSIEDGVLVLGATNRPSVLDAALLRPGRFDKVIYVPPPDYDGRRLILRQQAKMWKTANSNNPTKDYGEYDNLELDQIAHDSVSGLMTGAEIVGACKEAAMLAVRDSQEAGLIAADSETMNHYVPVVTSEHLKVALKNVKPLLSSTSLLQEYSNFEERHRIC
mmetsp:Transcript_58516/g.174263  ORF Transcript_58516/g.174263 Transcript_58516/m.174263 type:complete len:969 (-) Transcript_58516:356-3262(-)|eukprot:CAMPEP_0113562232 /NCGR_PEP_ID=MMETSP0015_2-20120614/20413_1 /TAXON_ID=2838 /ORGANISM="Odontella" /LENGTH=968 /DNA_ID=CAMNT_0000464107 /DNA_START=55 /DNA_END=2961 /DNA_ORIENTATION=+ /assembly_acc=CAM_ASM_000160